MGEKTIDEILGDILKAIENLESENASLERRVIRAEKLLEIVDRVPILIREVLNDRAERKDLRKPSLGGRSEAEAEEKMHPVSEESLPRNFSEDL